MSNVLDILSPTKVTKDASHPSLAPRRGRPSLEQIRIQRKLYEEKEKAKVVNQEPLVGGDSLAVITSRPLTGGLPVTPVVPEKKLPSTDELLVIMQKQNEKLIALQNIVQKQQVQLKVMT